jgi:hypothetical protein
MAALLMSREVTVAIFLYVSAPSFGDRKFGDVKEDETDLPLGKCV